MAAQQSQCTEEIISFNGQLLLLRLLELALRFSAPVQRSSQLRRRSSDRAAGSE